MAVEQVRANPCSCSSYSPCTQRAISADTLPLRDRRVVIHSSKATCRSTFSPENRSRCSLIFLQKSSRTIDSLGNREYSTEWMCITFLHRHDTGCFRAKQVLFILCIPHNASRIITSGKDLRELRGNSNNRKQLKKTAKWLDVSAPQLLP